MITIEQIKTKNYTAEELRNKLLACYDGKKFDLNKLEQNVQRNILGIVGVYNRENKDKTSFEEIVYVLTGKSYEQYFKDNIKSAMDENGVVSGIDQETRTFLKNKYGKMKKLNPEKYGKYDISEMIADFVPGAKYVALHPITEVETLDRLSKITDKNGVIEFTKDENLRSYFRRLAKQKSISLEEAVKRTGHKFSEIKERFLISKEEHIQNILNCVDSNKNIVDLSKRYPATAKFLNVIAHKNNCSMNIAVNELLGSGLQEYNYRGANNKLSKYSLENPSFIGYDKDVREKVSSMIRKFMTETGDVVGLYNSKAISNIILKISQYNDITVGEAIKMFVPEVNYIERKSPEMKHQTKEDVLANLPRFDDGSGCIDAIRKYSNAIAGLRRVSNEEGLHISEFVEKYSPYHFSACEYEVDYIDYVVSRLVDEYGVGGDVSGLYENMPLYDAVKRIRNFFPGGALDTMEETLMNWGFSYSGMKGDTKVNETYVRELLFRFYQGSNVIDSLYENKVVSYAVINYSGQIGKSVKETLEDLGYIYERENRDNTKRLGRKKMTPQEYKKYISSTRENSEPGDE